MVCLRAAHLADIFIGTQHGFLDLESAGFGVRQHWNGDQYYRNCSLPALPGNGPRQDASVGVAQSDHGGAGGTWHQPPLPCPDHVAFFPLPRRTFLLSTNRLLRTGGDAPLLCILSSRKLSVC